MNNIHGMKKLESIYFAQEIRETPSKYQFYPALSSVQENN